MGYYREYLEARMDVKDVDAERKKQLRRISELRDGRFVLSYASDHGNLDKARFVSIDYSDVQLFADQLQGVSGDKIDVLIETPGGSGQITEQLVRMIRAKFHHVSFIVPGCAKSAGTIMVLGGDEILMGNSSALGPIDAQIFRDGKQFSAHALLERFEVVKKEIESTGKLNAIYIPILQKLSLGEIEDADRALSFAKDLVREWLAKYKFKDWEKHESDGSVVTDQDRTRRAEEIATCLCDHGKWKTHGKSIMLEDLSNMRLRIENFSANDDLSDAIERYHTLLLMTFQMTSAYKIIETPDSQVVRLIVPRGQSVPIHQTPMQNGPQFALFELECPKCHKKFNIQAKFDENAPDQPGMLQFPKDNLIACPHCGTQIDLSPQKLQIEMQTGRKIL